MTDENYEARAQTHLASLKRDMRVSLEDAVVRAAHKVMAEFEAMSDERLMEDWGPGPHECHSLPERGPEQPAQQEPVAWMYPDDHERMLTNETFCTVYSVEVGSATRGESTVPLYTSPPQRQPLTNGELYTAYITATGQTLRPQDERLAFAFARAIEASHGIRSKT